MTTDTQLAQRALEASGLSERELPLPRLIAMVPQALELASDRIARGPAYKSTMRQYAAITNSGIIDLTAQVGILFVAENVILTPHGEAMPAVLMSSYEELVFGEYPSEANGPSHWAERGTDLIIRTAADGLTTSAGGESALTANYVMSVSDSDRPIPSQHEGAVIATLLEVAKGDESATESSMTGRA